VVAAITSALRRRSRADVHQSKPAATTMSVVGGKIGIGIERWQLSHDGIRSGRDTATALAPGAIAADWPVAIDP